MLDIQNLIGELEVNYNVIHRQIDGLTHEDSLLQVPFRGNCLNWVLGHIVASRNGILTSLGQEPILDEDTSALYRGGSEPITGPEDEHLPLEEILSLFEQSQKTILSALESIDPEELEIIPEGSDRTRAKRISFLSWHETYHVGQTEYLRQLAGMNDKVI